MSEPLNKGIDLAVVVLTLSEEESDDLVIMNNTCKTNKIVDVTVLSDDDRVTTCNFAAEKEQ